MNTDRTHSWPRLIVGALALLLAACASGDPKGPMPPQPLSPQVVVTEDAKFFYLANNLVAARISKESGAVSRLTYKGVDTLHPKESSGFVFWSHDTRGGESTAATITIDPKANGGGQGEVSVKAISGGKLMGHGPGAPPEGDLAIDIDIRYALKAGDSALYTYTAFEHQPTYPDADFVEARVAAILNPIFDHIHVDDERHGKYPLFNENTDKYVYSSLQWKNRAYGWTSEAKKLGWFMLVPSPEFLSGGPTKAEFLAHGTSPTVLSYWKSSHAGGASATMSQGETWRRVVGPFVLYMNDGGSPDALWANAKARLKQEEAEWPYAWVNAPGYASAAERGELKGEIALQDPLSPVKPVVFTGDLYVGLTRTPYEIPGEDGDPRTITWQTDARTPQFWTRVTDRSGKFAIPKVPAGDYTLTAFADGVLGEFARVDVTVKAGETVDLGRLIGRPQRFGRQLWEIGRADRTATEFAGGDDYYRPGQPLRYAKQFPDDIEFTIGKSKPGEDWYYAHMPHGENPDAKIVPFAGVEGEGRDAPRVIKFNLPERPRGRAYLRIAISGTGGRPVVDLTINGQKQTPISFGRDDGTLKRHQVNGVWKLIDTPFEARLLRAGENTITLTVPAGKLSDGVVYDYLRLELDD